LIFGVGLIVAFLIVLSVAPSFIFLNKIQHPTPDRYGLQNADSLHEAHDGEHFLGNIGAYSGNSLSQNDNRELPAGPGQIIGSAMVDGKPLEGLRLRLVLNDRMISPWATTDSTGKYEIGAPYGDYRIAGYELDGTTADEVVAGKIDDPGNEYSHDKFEVSNGMPGRGPDFKFVEPIRLEIAKETFSADEEVVIGWKPYPGADAYSVQVFEKDYREAYVSEKSVFPWSGRQTVKEPSINLSDHIKLQAGHYYRIQVDAVGEGGAIISRTASRYSEIDFEVVD
jgi:hypothetical protein